MAPFVRITNFIKKIRSKEKGGMEYFRYILAELAAGMIYPKYYFSDFGSIWRDDRSFLDWYDRTKENNHSADRKFFLLNILNLILDIEGDTAECGVYKGDSSYLICQKIQGLHKKHFLFDSFQGLSNPQSKDGGYWEAGSFDEANEAEVRKRFSEFGFVEVYPGWIPEAFHHVEHRKFCFVHIDVDLFQPTMDSLSFFYPRLVSRGIFLFDDYGSRFCPGAKQAIDTFFAEKNERIVHLPTAQAFVIKE